MKRNTEQNKKNLIEAMKKHHGIVSKACATVGLSLQTFYVYYRSDEDFKAQIDSIDELNLDTVEDKLFENIMDRDRQSIFFYLKYKGRKRGYIDSSDININGTLDINLKNLFGFESEDNTEE